MCSKFVAGGQLKGTFAGRGFFNVFSLCVVYCIHLNLNEENELAEPHS